jgi:hypothetical protein
MERQATNDKPREFSGFTKFVNEEITLDSENREISNKTRTFTWKGEKQIWYVTP